MLPLCRAAVDMYYSYVIELSGRAVEFESGFISKLGTYKCP